MLGLLAENQQESEIIVEINYGNNLFFFHYITFFSPYYIFSTITFFYVMMNI